MTEFKIIFVTTTTTITNAIIIILIENFEITCHCCSRVLSLGVK
jgi:hypothetical protein